MIVVQFNRPDSDLTIPADGNQLLPGAERVRAVRIKRLGSNEINNRGSVRLHWFRHRITAGEYDVNLRQTNHCITPEWTSKQLGLINAIKSSEML